MEPVLYTAIYGPGYDQPKPVAQAGCHAVLYTDQLGLEAPGWEVRVEPLPWISTPMLRAKYWKTHPEELGDVEVSLWIDGSLTPLEGYAARCVGALGDRDMALTPHPWRDCIYDELEASVGLPKYDAESMQEQCELYRFQGHPAHWGLFASGAIARRHTPTVLSFSRAWWFENKWRSWQDQLSLPVVLRNYGSHITWSANMPWATWWGYTEHFS